MLLVSQHLFIGRHLNTLQKTSDIHSITRRLQHQTWVLIYIYKSASAVLHVIGPCWNICYVLYCILPWLIPNNMNQIWHSPEGWY